MQPEDLKVLVTGSRGFVGKNLCFQLNAIKDGKDHRFHDLAIDEVMEYDIDSTPEQLDEYCSKADFAFNLAGVNRPTDPEDFKNGNFGFASTLLDTLRKHGVSGQGRLGVSPDCPQARMPPEAKFGFSNFKKTVFPINKSPVFLPPVFVPCRKRNTTR